LNIYFKVDPTQQQDENWLFGKIGNDKQGFFPAAYAERIPYVTKKKKFIFIKVYLQYRTTPNGNSVDTTSPLMVGKK